MIATPTQQSFFGAALCTVGLLAAAGGLVIGWLFETAGALGGPGTLSFLVACATAAGAGAALTGAMLAARIVPTAGRSVRWGVAGALAVWAMMMSASTPDTLPTAVLLAYIAAICLLMPRRLGSPIFVFLLAIQGAASLINAIKSDLTGLPLTMLDIRIAVANPAGLWDALALPGWTRPVVIGTAAGLLAGWLLAMVVAARHTASASLLARAPIAALGRFAALAVLAVLMLGHVQGRYVEMASDDNNWEPYGVRLLVDRVGILPFLAYSYQIESSATGDIYHLGLDAKLLAHEEVRDAISQYFTFPAAGDVTGNAPSPNVIVILAESTFDPGLTFRLEGAWNDALFTPTERTADVGLLRVNVIGGGTWITEFETIVGLDSRLFGYSGYYTHASISPFVSRSIATHFTKRGYATWAFFPHEGSFYNARRAYENYGFERVLDSTDLGLPTGWSATDRDVVERVIKALGTQPETPFFAYLSLLENHAPHQCDIADEREFVARFADNDEFEPNCALHEYLRRLNSTTQAVQEIEKYLTAIETGTGRPYVVLVFGDHIPHTFTGAGDFQRDFSAMLKINDLRTTFFHLVSTTPTRINGHLETPPATLLPTLLSGLVARDPDDVFLGENLWLYAHCGSDPIQRDYHGDAYTAALASTGERSEQCAAAYERALESFRLSGIVRLRTGGAAR